MRWRPLSLFLVSTLFWFSTAGYAADGNRLTYLDGSDPYYVHKDFPKLTTPQWVGEEGVEAVVVLAIDDMREPAKYEEYFRPILNRLKAIDGRAPVSIMTCRVNPNDPQLQAWLKEGLNIDVHSIAHPCPLLQKSDFAAARTTVFDCVDLLNKIPGNRPVAFRVPCCDSLNTPSPRFFAEIFNKPTADGNFMTIDSSVFNILSPADPALPRKLVLDPDGRERFRKYLPFPSFVNTIENYPYPYVIGGFCWEFPCVVPSDWEAFNLQKAQNPKTVEDLKAALDAVVLKQGVFNLVFHPYGWLKGEQVADIVDYAVKTHGKKVKFLNFREALERLEKYLQNGESLRVANDVKPRDMNKNGVIDRDELTAAIDRAKSSGSSPTKVNGADNGVRVLDVNNDGYLDVIIANESKRETRIWVPETRSWKVLEFPFSIVGRYSSSVPVSISSRGVRFGVLRPDGMASVVVRDKELTEAWQFDGQSWTKAPELLAGLEIDGKRVDTALDGGEQGIRLRDLDGDGRCELIASNLDQGALFTWAADRKRWVPLPFTLPAEARVVGTHLGSGTNQRESKDGDAGLRFADLDEDGFDDVIFSNDEQYGIYLFDTMKTGWSRKVTSGTAGDSNALPKIVREGTNNGFWAHSRVLWWQNEDTAKLPDLVDRRSFNDLLMGVDPRVKSPLASLKSIRVRSGFQVEQVACEPLVSDPIAFDWSADGRLWVVEMGDYPLGTDGKGKHGGVVRVLEDTNGDGRYDKSTTFLEGLGFPTGILPWRKGVIIGCAPEIFYAEDRDGDGKADHKEVLFTGFREGNQQHRLNGFDFGLDGWIYGANGDSGGRVRSLKSDATVSIQGRDFRFRPDDGKFEAESGGTQYGRHRDDWGNWFGDNNPNWAWIYMLADADIRRNPKIAAPDPKQMLEPDRKLFPVSRSVARFNDFDNLNRTTSANSPTPYRDDLFGPAFARSLFVSEPVHNLVHRMVLEPEGSTFVGHRAPDELNREFLASSDNWFRPTMMRTGPDGALWIADMYRAVIEHPEWIPDDWEARLNLRAGAEEGHIYRVYPVDRKPRPIPRLDRLDTAGLVAAIDSPNGWQRDTAQRLLLHSGDRAALEPLRKLAATSQRPKARVQALWTLADLNALDPETVKTALADSDPEVRRHAIETGMALAKDHPDVGEAIALLANDSDASVRFALATRLGDWPDPRAARALARVIQRDPADRWLRAAVMSSSLPHASEILMTLFADAPNSPPPSAYVEPLFVVAGSQPEHLARLVGAVTTPEGGKYAPWQMAALVGLLDSTERAGSSLDKLARNDVNLQPAVDRVVNLFKAARALVADEKAAADDRLVAIRLLGRSTTELAADLDQLTQLLRPQEPAPLQAAAVSALGRLRDPSVADRLLASWKGFSPQIRSAVLDVLLSRETSLPALLSALEQKQVPAAEVDVARRRRLLNYRDEAIRRRADALFAHDTGAREEVIARYRSALTSPGDATRGAAVFKKVCATCHRLGGEGVEVGPDLQTLTDKSPEALLVAILDPNRAVEAKFTNFTVATNDGRVLSGLIATETGNSVTLRAQEGKEYVLLRSEISDMAGSGQSLMPEGIEKDLPPADFADLIAYLSATGPGHRQVPGNHPALVKQGDDGVIALKAPAAEIYGDLLTIEPKHGNLGLWSEAKDYAAWTFEVDKPGRYAVWLDWACADASKGTPYQIEIGTEKITGRVVGTGTWDDYRQESVGEVTLPPGRQRLIFRPADNRRRGALIALRTVELRPLTSEAKAAPCSCCGAEQQ
jgi:putative membrane-bound dehydrogenase-like protein